MTCPAKLEKTAVIYTLVNNAFCIHSFEPEAWDISPHRQSDKSFVEGKRIWARCGFWQSHLPRWLSIDSVRSFTSNGRFHLPSLLLVLSRRITSGERLPFAQGVDLNWFFFYPDPTGTRRKTQGEDNWFCQNINARSHTCFSRPTWLKVILERAGEKENTIWSPKSDLNIYLTVSTATVKPSRPISSAYHLDRLSHGLHVMERELQMTMAILKRKNKTLTSTEIHSRQCWRRSFHDKGTEQTMTAALQLNILLLTKCT